MRWLDSTIHSMDMNLSNLWEIVEDRGAWLAAVHGVAKRRKWLTAWTMTTKPCKSKKDRKDWHMEKKKKKQNLFGDLRSPCPTFH